MCVTTLLNVNCGKGEDTHVPAQRAGKFFFCGTGLPTAVRKNQPLVPRSNIAGSWTRGGGYMPTKIRKDVFLQSLALPRAGHNPCQRREMTVSTNNGSLE